MKKQKIYTLITAVLVSTLLMAQSPSSFKYQAVLRNIRGDIRANADATILIEITKNQGNGAVIYSETHKVKTDNFGLIDLEIGKGTPVIGNFAAISWGNGTYFVKISVDGVLMGTAQLHSVPYALYAEKAGNGFSGDYNDLINKPYIFDGTWQGVFGKPAFATVATTGQYNDLLGKPVMFDGTWSSLTGKPNLALVATSGNYNDLINKPILTGTVTNVTSTSPVVVTSGSTTPAISIPKASAIVNGYLSSADWTTFNNKSSFNGAWASLTGKPNTIAGYGITDAFNGTWENLASKPLLSKVATTGVYDDLINKPAGNKTGDMQYWNGTDWVVVPVGKGGQYLQLSDNNVPVWTGPAFPTLITTEPTSVTGEGSISGGNITDNGGASIVARGICWSITDKPTIELSTKTNDGTGTGSFTSIMTDLASGTTYNVRAYATNSVGTVYGNQISFTTLSTPVLSTSAISSITENSASGGGNITNDGGAVITSRGICWGTTANPAITNSVTINGTGTGEFASSMTGLTVNTTYYVRAYATNSIGTAYGNEINFVTNTSVPALTTTSAGSIMQTTATIGGIITSDGGAVVTARGVCWSTSSNPTIALSTTMNNGTGPGTFTSSITGLIAGTKYYAKAYATNSLGTAYGNEISFTTLAEAINYANGNEAYWNESANGFRKVRIGGGDLIFEYDGVNHQYVSGNLILVPNKESKANGDVVDKTNFYGFSGGTKSNTNYQWDGKKNPVITGASDFDRINLFVSPMSGTMMTYAQAINAGSSQICTSSTNSTIILDAEINTLAYPANVPQTGTFNLWNGAELISIGVPKNSPSSFGSSNEYVSQQQLALTVNKSFCVATYGQGWRLPTDLEVGHLTNAYSPAAAVQIDEGYQTMSGEFFTSSRFYYPGYAFYKWYVGTSTNGWIWNNIDQWSKTKYQVRCVYNGR